MTDEGKRKKKSANFALEQMVEEKSEPLTDIWRELKDGFASPEQALDYAKANKIQGVIRAIRIASSIFGGSVVIPEPVYSLVRVGDVVEKTRKPRGRKKGAEVAVPPVPPVPPVEVVPLTDGPIPPEEDLDAST
jgi:hypothetical protein